MPIYQFECEACKKGFERYLSLRKEKNPPCECGGATQRVWALGVKQKGDSVYPYITKNITGKPLEITSASHLEKVCKENGVVNRADTAWLEKTHEGCDRKGKPVYREGSGLGMPGCWI